MLNKPQLSVVITSLKDPTITKTFNKSNGLMSVDVSGVSNTPPYYGIISRSGTVKIQDIEGWILEQNNNDVFPDVEIKILLNDCLLFSFNSQNDIEYTIQDKEVNINLQDEMVEFQNKYTTNKIRFSNIDALTVLNQIFYLMGLNVNIEENTMNYLKEIKVENIVFDIDTYWNIIQNIVYGIQCIFYKIGSNYYIRSVI